MHLVVHLTTHRHLVDPRHLVAHSHLVAPRHLVAHSRLVAPRHLVAHRHLVAPRHHVAHRHLMTCAEGIRYAILRCAIFRTLLRNIPHLITQYSAPYYAIFRTLLRNIPTRNVTMRNILHLIMQYCETQSHAYHALYGAPCRCTSLRIPPRTRGRNIPRTRNILRTRNIKYAIWRIPAI